MGLFTRYAMDALMKTSHPEVIRRQCWNLHPPVSYTHLTLPTIA